MNFLNLKQLWDAQDPRWRSLDPHVFAESPREARKDAEEEEESEERDASAMSQSPLIVRAHPAPTPAQTRDHNRL